ncbi:MAG: response regulator [Deltaproteobacteria bacterium]|nr:response regulator [Deltaproteobacteria bacterium]
MSTILIVEDHAISRHALKTLLGYYGHRLLEAADGSAALALARSERPDLIISDIVMPTMDGLEFVRRLRAEEGLETTPVIFYTATYRLPEARRLVQAFGACSVIPKPSEPTVLLEAVHGALGVSPEPVPTVAPEHVSALLPAEAPLRDGLQLATLIDLGFHLVSQRDPAGLSEIFCSAVRSLLECRFAQLVLLERNGARSFGDDKMEPTGPGPAALLPSESEIREEVVSQRRILRFGHSDAFPPGKAGGTRLPPAARSLVLPFATPSHAYGWFCLADRVNGAFTDEDEEMAVALSSQAALAYENILLLNELRQREELLRRNEERLRLASDSTDLGTYDWDPQTGELIWSEAAKRHFGLSPDAPVDYETFLAGLHPEDRERVGELVRRMLQPESGGEYRVEYRTIGLADGKERWIASRGRVIFDEAGRAIRFVGTTLDITERKRFEQELLHAREAAQAGSRAKSEFLARMSHEIRTPMNGVMGMTELALLETESPKARDYLRIAKESAKSLLAIIDEVLDLARIEAGRVELQHEEFELRDALEGVLETVRVVARNKGLPLALDVESGVPRTVRGDRGRIGQVLLNLVGNALKFTDAGGVSVTVGVAGPTGPTGPTTQTGQTGQTGRTRLLFTVTDTGIGISPDQLEVIFENFSQANPAHHVTYGGTGLGLSISRQLVGLMGGHIWAESEPGRGSAFRFELQLEVPPAKSSGQPVAGDGPATRPPKRLRVLLAEDNPVNQVLGRELLVREGHEVTVASNGQEALQALARACYDVVLMDVQMPILDGLDAARAIRGGIVEGCPAGIPIVALTAHALKGDRERFLEAGMDEYISKPIQLGELYRVLAEVAGGQKRR